MAAIAVVGFWPRYFGPLVFGTLVQPSLLIHIHAAVFSGWLVLFFLQAYFAGTGRIPWHLAVGSIGIWYGVLLIVVGLLTGVLRSAASPPGRAEIQGEFWSVSVPRNERWEAGAPVQLFPTPAFLPLPNRDPVSPMYDVSKDGRFLIMVPGSVDPGARPAHILWKRNWAVELEWLMRSD